jgi:sporulation protein YlmC with PRC-barrel domain
MIVRYSSLIGGLVAELRDQTKVGKISEIIIDKDKLAIAAFVLEGSFWTFSRNKIVTAIDVVYTLKDGAIINDIDSIIDAKESVSISKLIDQKCYGVGQKVITCNGEGLGNVYDFLINTEDLSITKFYIKHFLRDRIITVNRIVNMDGRVITIKDSSKMVRTQALPATDSACS